MTSSHLVSSTSYCFLGLLASAILWPSHADVNGIDLTKWYVSPMLALVDDNQNRNVDDGIAGLHLGVGRKFADNQSFEFKTVFTRLNSDGFNADQFQWGLGVDYIYEFRGTGRFIPYGILGAGFIQTQNDNPLEEDGTGYIASLGAGVFVKIPDSEFMLRVDLRVRNDRSTKSNQDVLLGFGVHRYIKAKPIVIYDADKDGVADDDDRCGNTPPDQKVDRFGCAY